MRWVVDSSQVECFAALDARSADPAVGFATLVAGPGLFEWHLELSPTLGDTRLRQAL